MFHPTEPLLLGLSSGLACLPSCGTILLPWMSAEQRSLRATAGVLSVFMGGRLLGYMAFALPAWAFGWLLARNAALESWVFGIVHLALAVALAAYALPFLWPKKETAHGSCRMPLALSVQRRFKAWTPLILGVLTGLNLCPPFIAAVLRVASGTTWIQALAFFLLFFLGTTPWLFPFIATGALRKIPGLPYIARFVMLLLALYYAYLGSLTLLGRIFHGS